MIIRPTFTLAGAVLVSAATLSTAWAAEESSRSGPTFVAGNYVAQAAASSENPDLLPRTELAQAPRGDTRNRPLWLRGTYIELRAGASFLADADNSGGSLGGSDTDFDTGYTTGGAIGYSLADSRIFSNPLWNNIRVEFEGFFSRGDVDSVTAGTALFNDRDSEISASGGMFNAYYDFDLGSMVGPRFARWTPYVGAGVGGAVIDVDDAGLSDDSDAALAWQARTGIGYALTPRTTVSLGYRYFQTQDPDLRAGDGSAFESEYRSHTAEVGLRYMF